MATRAKLTIVLAFFAGIIGGASSRYLVPIRLHAQTQTDKDGVLHVRGIVVDDQDGHERVRLGAPVPDPLIHGVRRKRVAPVSGLIITDGAGNERGGFTTNEVGEAFIGLDSEDEQQVLFLANPHGGVNFDLFDSKGNEAQILVFPNGPTFTMKKAKQTVLELPK